MYHRQSLLAIKAKNGGKLPTHEPESTVLVKVLKFYPAHDVKETRMKHKKSNPHQA
jgi:large subunit ribosomal protein L6e